MASCRQSPDREKAIKVLRWLEKLSISRSCAAERGFCSTCVLFFPCREVAIGDRVATADSSGSREYWMEEYNSGQGPDGLCQRKPIMRQVIAALSVVDDHFLGKVITKLASDQDGVDVSISECARPWFEERVQFKFTWFPNMLWVFEMLVISFYYRQNKARDAIPLCGFPLQPAGLAAIPADESDDEDVESRKRNDTGELQSWEASLDWWIGKCSFCAGRGLPGNLSQHGLRQCPRGGKRTMRMLLPESIYEEGMLPSNGCRNCHLPHNLCDRWYRVDDGT